MGVISFESPVGEQRSEKVTRVPFSTGSSS